MLLNRRQKKQTIYLGLGGHTFDDILYNQNYVKNFSYC